MEAFIYASNFSLGVNLFFELNEQFSETHEFSRKLRYWY